MDRVLRTLGMVMVGGLLAMACADDAAPTTPSNGAADGATCSGDGDCESGRCDQGMCVASGDQPDGSMPPMQDGSLPAPDAGPDPMMDATMPMPTMDSMPPDTVPCGAGTCGAGQRCDDSGDFPVCVFLTCGELTCNADQRCVEGEAGVSGASCQAKLCDSDLACAPGEFCNDEGTCSPDVCDQGAFRCEGSDLFECARNGSVEAMVFSCGGFGSFTSACIDDGSQDYCSCQDDWDCPSGVTCEGWDPELGYGRCVSSPADCRLPPEDITGIDAVVEFTWGGTWGRPEDGNRENRYATGSPFPTFSQAIMTPVVINLDDDNDDGLVNDLDTPEIVFVTYEDDAPDERDTREQAFRSNGVLRAVHGGGPNRGKDFWASCGDTVWHEGDDLSATCVSDPSFSAANDPSVNPTAGIAAGDIDGDGLPEIVTIRENPDRVADNRRWGFEIYNRLGENLYRSGFDDEDDNDQQIFRKTAYIGAAPLIANMDGRGPAEIIVGRFVFGLKIEDGNWSVSWVYEAKGAFGDNVFGPIPCVAELDGEPGLELINGTTVYQLPPVDVDLDKDCTPTDPSNQFCAVKDMVRLWDGPTDNPGAFWDPEQNLRNGFCAVADVWGPNLEAPPGPDNAPDGKPEVVTISNGFLQIFEGDTGYMIHRADVTPRPFDALSNGDPQEQRDEPRGGPPNIDDFDGDGFPEIGSAFAHGYVVTDLQAPSAECPEWRQELGNSAHYLPLNLPDGGVQDDAGAPPNGPRADNCLHNGWVSDTEDISRATGSSVFDLNGDGRAEVLYKDECTFRIYDGTTGGLLLPFYSTSRTRIEYPVIADVDNDGNAEIIFTSSTDTSERVNCDGFDEAAPNNGLNVLGDADDLWVSARRIWNQHAYSVTNVFESGGVPAVPQASWVDYGDLELNTYRSNPRSLPVAPDLSPVGMQVSSPDATCGQLSEQLEIRTLVENLGDLRVGPDILLTFEGKWGDGSFEPLGDGNSGQLSAPLGVSLGAGAATSVTVTYNTSFDSQGSLPDTVRVTVDGPGAGVERECQEDNNVRDIDVDAGGLLPDVRVEVGALDGVNCELRTEVFNDGSAPASGVVVQFVVGDPQQGASSVLQEEVIDAVIQPGESVVITPTLALPMLLTEGLIYAVVDPAGVVPECNDGNNSSVTPTVGACTLQ